MGGKPGFVTDMTDVDQFEPIEPLPISSFYLVHGLSRGDDLAATRRGFSCTLARDNA